MTFRGGASRAVVAAVFACLHSALSGFTPYVWTGAGADSKWTNSANWQNGAIPPNDGTAAVSFGAASHTHVVVDTSQSVNSLAFNFTSSSGYASYFVAGSTTSLTIGSGGINATGTTSAPTATAGTSSSTSSSSYAYFAAQLDSSLGLILGADQTWTAPGAYLYADGPISGTGKLTLASGSIMLAGNNTYSGGTVLSGADVSVGSDAAFGTGAVIIGASTDLFNSGGNRTLANALNLNADLFLSSYEGAVTFSGPVTLGADVRIYSYGDTVYLNGPIGEVGGARKLTISNYAPIVLSGANTYTGGTSVDYGALIFRNATSVPANGRLTASYYGYIGIGFPTGVQSGFIGRFDPATMQGTIGFDTDPSAATPTSFAEPIDLTGFLSGTRIGTVTRATLTSTATITPATGAGYQFGGGGGTLAVESKLTGANSITADSPQGEELTVKITNTTNDFTGMTAAAHSAIVFGGNGALPAGAGTLMANTGGYIGTLDSSLSASQFISRFSPTMTTGVIGFDSASVTSPRSLSSPIDLSQFTAAGTMIALGTASAATIDGPITLPPTQNAYYFTGYKGGVLIVNSALSGTTPVRIGGTPNAFSTSAYSYPVYDPNDASKISTVSLNGNNSYSGGTSLYGGRLVLGSATALGTGPLTIEESNTDWVQVHSSLTTNPTFANAISVKNEFEIGGLNAFGLSGAISDGASGISGLITKTGNFTLTVSGNNSAFTGGFNINEGTIAFTSDTGAGPGTLYFGYAGDSAAGVTPTAAFTSSAPSIGGLEGYVSGARVSVGSTTTLTVNQTWDGVYLGQLVGSGGLVKSGSASLRLESSSASFTGSTKILAGSLDVAASGALGTGTVTLNGPVTLFVEPGVTLSNPIAFGAGGGALAGGGTFGSPVSLGANSTVSPGNSVGTLAFASGLTLGGGSSYQFQVQDATGSVGIGYDTIKVTGSLQFTATMGAPFTIYLGSMSADGVRGNAVNFVETNAYSWQILSTTTGITGFDPAAVFVNTTGFTNSLGIGTFNVSQTGSGLFLNFTPVPEPSTWALLVSGLGALGIGAWRRRRRG